MRSASTITWVIYKRYNNFFELHQGLSSLKLVKMPVLPPKRLTRSLAAEFVEKRKVELQEYLRAILASPELRHTDDMLDFLEVPDSVRPMLARGVGDGHQGVLEGKDGDVAAREQFMSSQNYQQRSYDEQRVLDLVTALTYNRNKVAAIKAFESFFFGKRPRLEPQQVRLLLQGEHGAEREGGLVQTCGDFPYSHVAARAALDLMCRLLDVEMNKDAGYFIDELASLEPHVLKCMRLHLHILSERGNRLGAFKLLLVLQGRMPDLPVNKVVGDNWARQEFFKWAERKNEAFAPAAAEPQETALRPLSLSESSHRQIADQAFEEILAIAHNEQGWRAVDRSRHDEAAAAAAAAAGAPAPLGFRLNYKLDQRRDITVLRFAAVLPHSVDAVTRMLVDQSRRGEWDAMFHTGRRVEKLSRTADLVHVVYKSYSSPYKYRDFCLLRSWTKLESGGRMIATRSVLHPALPEQKDNIRAVLFPTGYIVTEIDGGAGGGAEDGGAELGSSCLVTYVAQLDREGVLIFSPDLLGETDQLGQRVNGLNRLLCEEAAAGVSRRTSAGDDDAKSATADG